MTEITEIARRLSSERIVQSVGEPIHETKVSPNSPIGMFDSGVGGLSVMLEVKKLLPREDVIYFADTARVPYGSRPPQEIVRINHEIIDYLIDQGVKLIVMACGTSSSIAYPVIRDRYKIPIVGTIGPGSRAAVASTRSGLIGLIATVGTVEAGAFPREIKALRADAQVFSQACPLFVPLIEGGFADADETQRVASEYLKPLKQAGVDTLVLGCTHYPHLRRVIEKIMGRDTVIVDPAIEVAKEVKEVLKKKGLLLEKSAAPAYTYLVSGSLEQFKDVGSKLLGEPIPDGRRVTLVAKKGPIE